MKKRYSEKYIKEVIEDQVFPKTPEEAVVFSLNHLITGSIIKRNGADFRADCALDVNEHGMLLVFIDDVQSDKEVVFHHVNFSDIQGIKVKNRINFRNITFQFKDGRNYVFECIKQSTSQLPNQSENLHAFISILETQNLHVMDNNVHKQNVKSNRKLEFSYIATLIVFLIAAMFFTFTVFPNSMVAMVIIIIAAGIIHFVFYVIGFLFLHTKKDRPFVKEFNAIMKEYREDENAEELLAKLVNIKSQPKTQDSKNTFYLTISTALYENNRTKEALEYLDKVQTTSEKEIEIIEEQRKVLEGVEK